MTSSSPDAYLRVLLDGFLGHGVVVLDADGIVVTWSAGARRLEGHAAVDIVGRPFADTFAIDERTAGTPGRVLAAARELGVCEQECWRVRRDGRRYWAEVVVTPLPGSETDSTAGTARPNGPPPSGYCVVMRDHTERRAAQLADARAREEMAAAHLQSQRLETVGRLAGGIAHDFNNLLAGIISYADLASGALAGALTERGLLGEGEFVQIADDLGEITAAANRAAALTRQLLIFSRREVVHPVVLDLRAVVGELASLLRRTLGEGVRLDVDLAEDTPLVLADRAQMEQICMNLAVNGRDAMGLEGGRLRIRLDAFDISEPFRALPPGRYARLTVGDDGEGMSATVADRAFEPFFTTKGADGGSGLGLATVYGIATARGGDVLIDSQLGVGTTVTVLLPATAQALPDPTDGTGLRPPTGRNETVLLVEDEALVRDSARRLLTRNGYRVLEAADAEEALRVARAHRAAIDLLLTDVVMPGRSGADLARQMAAVHPDMRVVFMSGYTADVVAGEGLFEDGTLMHKPFTAADLLLTVRRALDTPRPPGPARRGMMRR